MFSGLAQFCWFSQFLENILSMIVGSRNLLLHWLFHKTLHTATFFRYWNVTRKPSNFRIPFNSLFDFLSASHMLAIRKCSQVKAAKVNYKKTPKFCENASVAESIFNKVETTRSDSGYQEKLRLSLIDLMMNTKFENRRF